MTPWQEHSFWLHMLGDHAQFLFDYLSPREEKWVERAGQFRQAFDALLSRLGELDPAWPASAAEMIQFAQAAHNVAYGYFQLEGHLQHLRLHNEIVLNLTPTYLNGTLNENQEYLRLLAYFMRGEEPVQLALAPLIDLWLEDQLGHAALLRNNIDTSEVLLLSEIDKYIQAFSGQMVKQRQISRYLRFTQPGFPIQRQFVRELVVTVSNFTDLVQRVRAMHERDEVVNRLTLRFIDHHFPETRYFLSKLVLFAPETASMIKTD